MRLVRRRTFADILGEEAGQPERLPELLTVFEKVCQAMAYAHSKRVIHRDRGRRHPGGLSATIAWVPRILVQTYERAEQFEKAEPIYCDSRKQVQRWFGPDDPRTAGVLSHLGNTLLMQKKFPEAESLLRRCLQVREAKQPDEWTTFNTRSMLGEALTGQKKIHRARAAARAGIQWNGTASGQDPDADPSGTFDRSAGAPGASVRSNGAKRQGRPVAKDVGGSEGRAEKTNP
jgi:hypothetical protein